MEKKPNAKHCGRIRNIEKRKTQRKTMSVVRILNRQAELNHVIILRIIYVMMYSWKLSCKQAKSPKYAKIAFPQTICDICGYVLS
jgi:hypothetical protein